MWIDPDRKNTYKIVIISEHIALKRDSLLGKQRMVRHSHVSTKCCGLEITKLVLF